jgi:prophage antirepressor-like protein
MWNMLRSRFDILKGVYMRIENWYGHDIRFVEINGEWYAILKDICDALKLRSKDVSQRIDPNMLERVLVHTSEDGINDLRYEHKPIDKIDRGMIGKDISRKQGENKTRWMLAVNEAGIYQALFASRKLEARKFQLWTFDILKKLRKNVGLQGYEVMRMTEPDIQEQIDWILDSLYWDEERGCLMESYIVAGGDVEQRPFDVDEEE